MNNDIGTLDVLVGLRYTSIRISLAYEFTAPPTAADEGRRLLADRGFDGRLDRREGSNPTSRDGKWHLPYEADVADGNKNWQNNEFLAVGYRFRWGEVGLGARNLTYQTSDRPIVQKVRFTGPLFGATFRW